MFKLFRKSKSESERSLIVPRIKHTNMLAALDEMNVPPDELPFTEPLVADLLVAYAFDLPETFQMFKRSDLQRLGLTAAELRDIALSNLRRQLPTLKAEGQGTPVIMLTAGDLTACLLLIGEVWQDLADQIPSEVVVALPTRGIILVTSSEWPEGLSLMRELADGALERETTHRLTNCFLVRRNDRWMVFDPPA